MTRHDEPTEGDVTGVARAIRELVRVGHVGPNSAALLAAGGAIALTPTEAEETARALLASDALRDLLAAAWDEGHAAGRDCAGDGWNSDAHDPDDDNPYRTTERAQ